MPWECGTGGNVATDSRLLLRAAAFMQAVGLSFKAEATMYNE